MAEPIASATVVCATCGTPMRVFFNDQGDVERVLAPCKCPRCTECGSALDQPHSPACPLGGVVGTEVTESDCGASGTGEP